MNEARRELVKSMLFEKISTWEGLVQQKHDAVHFIGIRLGAAEKDRDLAVNYLAELRQAWEELDE